MKIFKWVIGLSFIGFSAVVLYWVVFAFLYSYGAGSGGTGSFKRYEFKEETHRAIKSMFDKTFDKNTIHINDSIVDGHYRGTFDEKLLIINSDKSNMQYIIELPNDEDRFYFYLIYVNGKISDDFGWFSLDKYRKVKLFEKEIIDPLSKKYQRIGE